MALRGERRCELDYASAFGHRCHGLPSHTEPNADLNGQAEQEKSTEACNLSAQSLGLLADGVPGPLLVVELHNKSLVRTYAKADNYPPLKMIWIFGPSRG